MTDSFRVDGQNSAKAKEELTVVDGHQRLSHIKEMAMIINAGGWTSLTTTIKPEIIVKKSQSMGYTEVIIQKNVKYPGKRKIVYKFVKGRLVKDYA